MIITEACDAGIFAGKKSAVTIGKFDGLHRGHRSLIRRITEKKKDGLQAVVYKITMASASEGKSLLDEEEEAKILEELGVDVLVRVPFTPEFASQKAEDFVDRVLVDGLHTAYLASGENFFFGAGRTGSPELLRKLSGKLGFEYECEPRFFYGEKPVSSTRIRTCLKEGRMEEAAYCLSEPYAISGTVVHGMHLASSLGFPTANICPPENKFLPAFGVYRVFSELSGRPWKGLANLGVKPTVTSEHKVLLEVCFPGFSGDLYGQSLRVSFDSFLRPEKKFGSVDELRTQMKADMAKL